MNINEAQALLQCIKECQNICFERGTRSSKIVDHLHNYIKEQLQSILDKEIYIVETEVQVPSINASGQKKCDIVIKKNINNELTIIAVFPVKFIRGNYKQNKNNGWETLTGEVSHLHWANPNMAIIPINIIFSSIPYKKKNSQLIEKLETITYEQSWKIYETLITQPTGVVDMYNYIIDVNHICKIGEVYDKCPTFTGFNTETPFKSFNRVKELLNGHRL